MIYNSNRSHFYTMRRANHSLMRAVRAEGIDPDSYLGHGMFSVVYATGEEAVAKLTVDPVVVRFCEEASFSYDDNPLFPKVFDVRSLGQEVAGFDNAKLPLYRIDCERLIPIKRQKGSIPWVRSLRIRRALRAAYCVLDGCDVGPSDGVIFRRILAALNVAPKHHEEGARDILDLLTNRIAEVAGVSQDYSEQLVELVREFVRSGGNLDIHGGNLMQRANGEVVINDILCTKDNKVWNAVHKYTGVF